MSLFTINTGKAFVKHLRNKRVVIRGIISFVNTFSRISHMPVVIANSGDKRLYEQILNELIDPESTAGNGAAQLVEGIEQIFVSVKSVSIDKSQNVSPHETNSILLDENDVPHAFVTLASQKSLSVTLSCKLLCKSSLDALDNTEYLIDNFLQSRTYTWEALGVMHSGAYAIDTTAFNNNANKSFTYDESENGTYVEFDMQLSLIYHALKTADLIKFIYDNMSANIDGNVIGDDSNNIGDNPILDGSESPIIVRYIGSVTVDGDGKHIYEGPFVSAE